MSVADNTGSLNTRPYFLALSALVTILLLALVAYFFMAKSSSGQQVGAVISAPSLVDASELPLGAVPEQVNPIQEVEIPLPEPVLIQQDPLPRLNQSDAPFLSAVADLRGAAAIVGYLVDEQVIRKAVRAVHGVSEGFVVKEYRPLNSPKGVFVANVTNELTQDEQHIYVIESENYRRYKSHIAALTQLSPAAVAELYRDYYPLLQQAYQELGLREPEFHSVMLSALNQALKPPTANGGGVSLKRPSVHYVFASPEMESQEGVQKLMWRMGSVNADNLVNWLRQFQLEISQLRGL